MKLKWIAILTALGMVSGCGQTMQKASVVDVSKAQKVALKTTASNVSGLTLHVRGQIDGEAIVSASNWEPQKISGKVDFKVYHDWFTSTCELQYQPVSAKAGALTVQYEFH
jgi:hypothetical protein